MSSDHPTLLSMAITQQPLRAWPSNPPSRSHQSFHEAMTTSSCRPQVSGDNYAKSSVPEAWNHPPALVHSPVSSSYYSTPACSPAPNQWTAIPAGSSSPTKFRDEIESPWPNSAFIWSEDDTTSVERTNKYDNYNGYNLRLPSIHTFISYQEPESPHSERSLTTLSTSPEPSGVSSSPSSLPPAHDRITALLNQNRQERHLEPLPHLDDLTKSAFPDPRKGTLTCEAPATLHLPPHLRQIKKKRRARSQKTAHCNIKYKIEELDYIRYRRMDLGLKWKVVEANFDAMFPMVIFPEPRKAQGLQGAFYRQNDILPHVRNGRLVFMENGHIEPTRVPTKKQIQQRDLYSLLFLFPERAMNYTWISPTHRHIAQKLNVEKQRQIEQGRLDAIQRGTYVEKLAPDAVCGCCPPKDRERNKKGHNQPKVTTRRQTRKSWAHQFVSSEGTPFMS